MAEPVELTLIAPIVELEDGRATLAHTHLDKQPDWTYDAEWLGQSPADRRAGPELQEER